MSKYRCGWETLIAYVYIVYVNTLMNLEQLISRCKWNGEIGEENRATLGEVGCPKLAGVHQSGVNTCIPIVRSCVG